MADKDGKRLTYFTHMSQAYAELCSGKAWVMSATPNAVPTNGIWFKTEFPTLQKTGNPGGQVNIVSLLSECLFSQLISFVFP
jgi:hypothetical protein